MSVNENSSLTAPTASILKYDTDVNNDTLSVGQIASEPSDGSLSFNSAAGSFTYTPNNGFSGTDSFKYFVSDGLASSTTTATVSITVNFVNQAPTFVAGVNQVVAEDSGPQTVGGWATGISAGSPSESGQALNFIVSNNNTGLFSAQPVVGPDGTLTYTPAAGASGTATVTVQLHDNGGVANGGVDTSSTQIFSITVTPTSPAR